MAFNIPQSPGNPSPGNPETPKIKKKETPFNLIPETVPDNNPFLVKEPVAEAPYHEYAGSFASSPPTEDENPYASPNANWEDENSDFEEISYGDGDGKIHPMDALTEAWTVFTASPGTAILTLLLTCIATAITNGILRIIAAGIQSASLIAALIFIFITFQLTSSLWSTLIQRWSLEQTRGRLGIPSFPGVATYLRFLGTQFTKNLIICFALLPSIFLVRSLYEQLMAAAKSGSNTFNPSSLDFGAGSIATIFVSILLASYLALKLSFATFHAVDPTNEDPSVLGSLVSSWKDTKGNFLAIGNLSVLLLLINLIGLALCGIGLLVTAPLSAFAYAIAYHQLRNHDQSPLSLP